MPSYTTDMEIGQFGNGADGNANTSAFSLDFAYMLDAADGELQHPQMYELFQGPAARQGQQLGAFQEDCFPFPPYPAGSGASLAAPSFHCLPDETLQAATATSLEQRTVDNGPLLSRTVQVANHGSHIQRNQFKAAAAAGSAAGRVLPTSTGSYIPPHLCSVDQAGNISRATFQYAPAKSSSVHTSPESAYIPIPREFSGYETSCSPNNLKRAAGCEMRSSQPRQGGKSQKVMSVPDHRVFKSKRPIDQAEHIMRERLRRDDMTSKFLALQTLLPPGPKRDRGTIVEDSIQYVKNLHHRLEDLQQKCSEMKDNRSTSGGRTTEKLKQKMGPLLDKKQIHAPAPCNVTANPFPTSCSSVPGHKMLDTVHVSSPSESDGVPVAKTAIEKVVVHLDLPHEIVIEMTCWPHGRIQSQILTALERLRMDVLRCSTSKLHGRIMCSIVVKPRVMTDPLITSDDIIRALERAVAQADS